MNDQTKYALGFAGGIIFSATSYSLLKLALKPTVPQRESLGDVFRRRAEAIPPSAFEDDYGDGLDWLNNRRNPIDFVEKKISREEFLENHLENEDISPRRTPPGPPNPIRRM